MRTQTDAGIDTGTGVTSTVAARVAASIQRYRGGAQRQQAAHGTGDDRYGCGCRRAAVSAVSADGTGAPRCGADLTPWCPPCLAAHVRGCPACDS